MATDEHRDRTAGARHGGDRRKRQLRDSGTGSLGTTPAIVILLLALFGTASAQDEGVLVPPPITGPPAPAPVSPVLEEEEGAPVEEEEADEEEAQEELRRELPFFVPEPSLTERLLPDAP